MSQLGDKKTSLISDTESLWSMDRFHLTFQGSASVCLHTFGTHSMKTHVSAHMDTCVCVCVSE